MPSALSLATGTRSERPSTRFDPRAAEAIAQARASVTLVRGTLAALRCRALIQQRAWPEAMAELLLLEASLCEVGDRPLDPETTREVAQLSIRKERLRSMIRPIEDCSVALLESA